MVEWLKERQKAIVAFVQAAAQAVNAFVPDYSVQTKGLVAVLIAGLAVVLVERVPNKRAARARS